MQFKKKFKQRVPYLWIPILIILLNTCTWGYVEVRNQSEQPIKDVRWGDILFIGDIAPGKEDGIESRIFETHYIYFIKDGIEYQSSYPYSIDAFTSATFIYHDTTKILQTSLLINKTDSLVPPNSMDAITGSTTFIEGLKKWFSADDP